MNLPADNNRFLGPGSANPIRDGSDPEALSDSTATTIRFAQSARKRIGSVVKTSSFVATATSHNLHRSRPAQVSVAEDSRKSKPKAHSGACRSASVQAAGVAGDARGAEGHPERQNTVRSARDRHCISPSSGSRNLEEMTSGVFSTLHRLARVAAA